MKNKTFRIPELRKFPDKNFLFSISFFNSEIAVVSWIESGMIESAIYERKDVDAYFKVGIWVESFESQFLNEIPSISLS